MHFASVFEKISRIIPEEPSLVCEDKGSNFDENLKNRVENM